MKREPIEQKLPVLVSYAFLKEMRNNEAVARIVACPEVEMLLDSGAFTALNAGHEIKLSHYMNFLQRWKKHLFGYMALDKLRDPKTTARNLKTMLHEGLKPIPVHVLGDDQEKMDELFELSEWVALGGLRRPHRGPAPLSYIRQKMIWANNRRVHWLGYTRDYVLRAFKPYSADCSSFASGMMYGRMMIYEGLGLWHSYSYKEVIKEKPHLDPHFRRLLDDYEVSVSDFTYEAHWHNGNKNHEIPAKKSLICRVPAVSWVRYVLEFKACFGTRIFLACIPPNFQVLVEAYRFVMEKGLVNAKGQHIRDNKVRGLPPVEGRAGGGGFPSRPAQAHLPRPRGERGQS